MLPDNAPKQPFQLGEIPADAKRGWEVVINGQVIPEVTSASIAHTRMGVAATYGQHPAGYDVVNLHEPGGGGAVTVPYAFINGELMVGVVKQNRPAAGGDVWELPRGFLDPGETHEEGALRETHEETGLAAVKARLLSLGGERNPNSTFFNTSEPGEGVAFFAIEVQPDELTEVMNPDGTSHYVFTAEIQSQAEDKAEERILGSKFIPVTEAVHSSDMMTEAGVGLLAAHMIGARTLGFAGVQPPTPIAQS